MEYEIRGDEVWIKDGDNWFNAGKIEDVKENYIGLIEDAE